MSICHHPSEALLLDYASGALGEAWSLGIASHLALCPCCRQEVATMEAVGGLMLEEVAPERLRDDCYKSVLSKLDGPLKEKRILPQDLSDGVTRPVIPQPLRGYLGGDLYSLQWRRLGLGASQILILTGDRKVSARLLRIPAGRPVPEHSHGGLELTLVLRGAFEDDSGAYHRGDLQEANEEVAHQPLALPQEDCICLAITDAPLRFKSLAARIAQPFLGI